MDHPARVVAPVDAEVQRQLGARLEPTAGLLTLQAHDCDLLGPEPLERRPGWGDRNRIPFARGDIPGRSDHQPVGGKPPRGRGDAIAEVVMLSGAFVAVSGAFVAVSGAFARCVEACLSDRLTIT
jgi:hypothetical protein